MKTVTAIALVLSVVATGWAREETPPPQEPLAAVLETGSFTAQLNGFDIHYEVHGSGPVLMVLPNSWGLSLEGLRGLLGALEEHLTMVYFDPRGMGESSDILEEADMGLEAVRDDFQALREHLHLESVNAIGWSNGAMNLVYVAAERPETIKSAVFLHGVASYTSEDMATMAAEYPEMIEAWTEFNQEMQDPDLTTEEKTQRMRAMWLKQWFPLSFTDREAAPETLDRIFSEAEFSWAHADYSQRAYPEFDGRDRLPLITARCLIITGVHDMTPVSKGEELADGIANAELVLFEESGHYAPAEEPERFEALVLKFLGVS